MAIQESETAIIQSGTAAGLLAFLDWVVAKGYGPAPAMTAQKSAARQVFAIVEGDDFDDVDVRNVDVDDLLSRFDVKARGRMKAESITTYRQRFQRALDAYREFLQTGKPPSYRQVTRKRASEGKTQANGRTPGGEPAEGSVAPMPPAVSPERMVDYPFPLKSGAMAHLRLPVRLEKEDADRMGAFLRTLVLEPQRALNAGESGSE